MSKVKLWAVFLPMILFLFGGCAKVYVQFPEYAYRKPTEKEANGAERRSYSPPEERYSRRSQDRREYERQGQGHPLYIRQEIQRMAEKYNVSPEEFMRAYEDALNFSRSEDSRVWRNIQLRILQNDGSVNRITQRYSQISGWIHETRIDRQTMIFFIPANRSFVFGIIENSRPAQTNTKPPDHAERSSAPRIDPGRLEEDQNETVVDPVSDEEAAEYYKERRGRQ